MRRWAMTALLTGIPFGVFLGFISSLFIGWRLAVGLGIFGGLLFGILMAFVAGLAQSRVLRNYPAFDGEELIKDGPANHFVGAEGVGGWLYVTNKRVFFKSHSFNFQTHEWSVPLEEVSRVEAYRTLGIFPRGLLIATNGGQERFVVNDNKGWVSAIQRLRQSRE